MFTSFDANFRSPHSKLVQRGGNRNGSYKKAIEATGTIDVQRQLVLDEPLPVVGPTKVRVIILLSEEADIDEMEWLQAAAANPALTS